MVYGQVKLAFTSPQGVEKVVEIIRPGQSFGEALMFLDKAYVVFAQALSDSMLLHVAKQAVFEELGSNPFGRRMIAGLARRLHGLVRDVEAYTLRSGEERFIGYLLAELPEGASDGAADVNLTPGKSVLASRLNMTPEHFSRILHELAAEGLIEVNGRSVRVPDVALLRRASGGYFFLYSALHPLPQLDGVAVRVADLGAGIARRCLGPQEGSMPFALSAASACSRSSTSSAIMR